MVLLRKVEWELTRQDMGQGGRCDGEVLSQLDAMSVGIEVGVF